MDENCPFYIIQIIVPSTLYIIYDYMKEIVELNKIGVPLYEKLSVKKIQTLYENNKPSITTATTITKWILKNFYFLYENNVILWIRKLLSWK